MALRQLGLHQLGLSVKGGGGLLGVAWQDESLIDDSLVLDSGQRQVALETESGLLYVGTNRADTGTTGHVDIWSYDRGGAGLDFKGLRAGVNQDTHDIPGFLYSPSNGELYATVALHNLNNYVQFWDSADGDVDNLGSALGNITGSSNAYQFLFQDPNDAEKLVLISREDSSPASHWTIYSCTDPNSIASWTARNTFFTGQYLFALQSKDGTGIWIFGRPSSIGYEGPGIVYTTQGWVHGVSVWFYRYSDDALLHADRSTVEDADVFTMTAVNPCGVNYLIDPEQFNSATGWTTNGDRTLQTLINGINSYGDSVTSGVFSCRATDEPNSHYWRQLSTDMRKAMVADERYSFCMKVAANTADFVRTYIGGAHWATFDLVNGTVHDDSGTLISSTITRILDDTIDWYWVTITAEPDASNIDFVQFALTDATGDNVSFDPNATTYGILVEAAQLNEGDPLPFDQVTDFHNVALPSQAPTFLINPTAGYSLANLQVEQVVDGYLEVAWAEIKGFQGVANGAGEDNESVSNVYYGRFNLSTLLMEGKTALCTTGDGLGSGAPNSTLLSPPAILGIREVVVATKNEAGSGTNYLAAFSGPSFSRSNLKSSASTIYLYPVGVKRINGDGTLSPTRKLWVGEASSYTDYTDWEADLTLMSLNTSGSLAAPPSAPGGIGAMEIGDDFQVG